MILTGSSSRRTNKIHRLYSLLIATAFLTFFFSLRLSLSPLSLPFSLTMARSKSCFTRAYVRRSQRTMTNVLFGVHYSMHWLCRFTMRASCVLKHRGMSVPYKSTET